MKFESVAGKAFVYVYQDFWTQVLVYNMVQDIWNRAEEEVATAGRENGTKYPMHTNENMAIGLFKEAILKILLEAEEMEQYVLPIRELPGKEVEKIFPISIKIIEGAAF